MLSTAAGTLGTPGMTVGLWGRWVGAQLCGFFSPLPAGGFFLPAEGPQGARFECRAGGCRLSP